MEMNIQSKIKKKMIENIYMNNIHDYKHHQEIFEYLAHEVNQSFL
jgi:hypothetical protein